MSSLLDPAILVFLIPIVAIAGGLGLAAYKEWLKHQSQIFADGNRLVAELENVKLKLADSEAEREALEQRLENVETILTSESWDLMLKEAELLSGQSRPALDIPEASDDEARDRTAQMARRLRSS